MTIMFITFLFGIFVLNLITPDNSFSESENRMLAQLPKFKIKNIISGRFTERFEIYVSDQFVFKNFWVSIKSDMERLSKRGKNNGIYFGKDGYLLEDYKKANEQLRKNIESINIFANKLPNISMYLLVVPNSVKIYEDKLPIFSSPYNQLNSIKYIKKNINQRVTFIDVYDRLKDKKDEYIYFRTDHHWTMRGAYYAYEVLSNYLGIKPYGMNDFHSEMVSDAFYGTLYSKANNRHIVPDSIEIFKPLFDIKYEVFYLDDNEYTDTLYEFKHLDKKDKYAMFLDGNHSLVKIKTSVKNNKKIAIIKDSYAHCFIPFLVNHYEEIHVIDLRYYKMDVYNYIKDHKIKEVLFLYNLAMFSADENMHCLKK
ncbi:hypothetical protein FQB35_08600 [Crassaminicella thermophila]|uniref:DHHW protein n=2 Tax=Crassaminicella thermophila TaxID=2599308 RepID=A0A5C0SGD1_CRATE|nr:hypothetical protein FQB35_08600 [Crassaminicella thermophila]